MGSAHARLLAGVGRCSLHAAARAGRVLAPEATLAGSTAIASDQSRPTNLSDTAFAFPRQARLLDGAGYASVFKRNRRLANRHWTLLACSRQGQPARLGLAIAKKRARHATVRNRLKRVARESFRCRQAGLEGLDIVVMNNAPAAAANKAELRRSLDTLWQQLAARQQKN